MFKPRPAQEAILSYENGAMGIAAVPGSGKTWTLSWLAASLITEGHIQEGQEVLVVTLVNSAVDNFRKRISSFLEQRGYLTGIGYRVRTLHSLAHEIISKVPSTVGVAGDFSVVDERIAEDILKGAFKASYPRYERALLAYIKEDISAYRRRRVVADEFPQMLQQVTRSAISHLKNRRIRPDALRDRLTGESPVMAFLVGDVYERYQHGLATRGALDFDDLITTAIRCLELDPTLSVDLRASWPYILEDEAQDSSALQEAILRMLVGDEGNWVRVGDPNQAIYETFTTAHPRYLRQFLKEADFQRNLPNSGRSGRPVIALANELIRWVQDDHPVEALRDALAPPYIEPTPPGDPQPNPPDEECRVALVFRNHDPELEREQVVQSLKKWLPDHKDETVAILVPTHSQGAEVIKVLEHHRVPYTDALLRLTTSTREAAGALSRILQHLAHPAEAKTLPVLYRVWYYRILREEETDESRERLERHLTWLRTCPEVSALIWPNPGQDWLEAQQENLPDDAVILFRRFSEKVRHWHGLVMLPISELLTALAQDLFQDPEKLAMTQIFGDLLSERSEYQLGVDRRLVTLDELQRELVIIAKDERRLRSVESDKTGFDPEAHRGEVVVATMHGSKGLEWDRVYLVSVNDYDFPSGQPTDRFRSERWFIQGSLSLEAETVALLDAALDGAEYEEGHATQEARYDYARERLRLLYVGITRARKELMITCNTGKGDNQPAVAFKALQAYLEKMHAST